MKSKWVEMKRSLFLSQNHHQFSQEKTLMRMQETAKHTPEPDNNNGEAYDEPDYEMGGAEEVQEDPHYVPDPESDDSLSCEDSEAAALDEIEATTLEVVPLQEIEGGTSEAVLQDVSEAVASTSQEHTMPITEGTRTYHKERKHRGLSYKTRKGKVVPAKECHPLLKCCTRKCTETVTSDIQRTIFSAFYNKLTPDAQHQLLCDGISLSNKLQERKRLTTKTGKRHNRDVTATYYLKVEGKQIHVCKLLFMAAYGLTKGKSDQLLMKLKSGGNEHPPRNKMDNQRKEMLQHINKYPKFQSHYSRRDSSSTFLPSSLNIAKMYDEYKQDAGTQPGSYVLFRRVFNTTGYKFKQPKVDTCKTCDTFNLKVKQESDPEKKAEIQEAYDSHMKDGDGGYDEEKKDKEAVQEDATKRVIVFDLQKVLDTPALTSGIAYYKRLLSTYNFTIRDCSVGNTTCYMWHEGVGGRGSDEIASCIFDHLSSLPSDIKHVITYSDSCGGQNRNINIAAMFSFVVQNHILPDFTIDQKFLLPGHTHLECDADHGRIEKAKKFSDLDIVVPRDWYQFVRSVRGGKPFNVKEMSRESFLDFSSFYTTALKKKTVDDEGEKINWLQIRWLRYRKPFGILLFKYNLNQQSPFRTVDFRRPRSIAVSFDEVPRKYHKPVPINEKKKQDLMSLLPLIPKEFHQFYKTLPSNSQAKEFDGESDDD